MATMSEEANNRRMYPANGVPTEQFVDNFLYGIMNKHGSLMGLQDYGWTPPGVAQPGGVSPQPGRPPQTGKRNPWTNPQRPLFPFPTNTGG